MIRLHPTRMLLAVGMPIALALSAGAAQAGPPRAAQAVPAKAEGRVFGRPAILPALPVKAALQAQQRARGVPDSNG